MYRVRRLKLGRNLLLDQLALECGRVYTATLVRFWRTVRKKRVWLKPSSMMRWGNSDSLHAHTADACVQAFFSAPASWRARRLADSQAKPPQRRRRFFRIEYKSSAIQHQNGILRLSNGRNVASLEIEWPWEMPKTVVIRWDGGQYEAIATYLLPDPPPIPVGRAVGIDLGEVHLATTSDGLIINGRYLRSLQRLRNKTVAAFQAKMDVKTRQSRRWKRLKQAKVKQLNRLDNRIRDVLHKATTGLVSTLANDGVQTLIIGDVRDIRQDLDCGRKANQKLHQWLAGRTRWYLEYKAQAKGMGTALQNEAFSSQGCPLCRRRNQVSGRVYSCPCGFVGHRDHVGALNILPKYQGYGPVVGLMARPTGWRYHPHARVARGFHSTPREAAAL